MIPDRKLKHTLPERIYVKRETRSDDPRHTWLVASDTLDHLDDGEVVGIYALQSTHTLHVTRALT